MAFKGHPRPARPELRAPHRGKPLCRPGWLVTLPMKAASVLGPHTSVPLVKLEDPQATEFLRQQKLEALFWRKAVALYHLGAYPLGQKYRPWLLRMDSFKSHARALITRTDTGQTPLAGRGGDRRALAQGGPMGEGQKRGLSLHCYT